MSEPASESSLIRRLVMNRQVIQIEIIGMPSRVLVTFAPCRHKQEIEVTSDCNLVALMGKQLTCIMCSEQYGSKGKRLQ